MNSLMLHADLIGIQQNPRNVFVDRANMSPQTNEKNRHEEKSNQTSILYSTPMGF